MSTQCLQHLEIPFLTKHGSGKVREIFVVDPEHLLIVATDRISAFDCILPTPIPDKGKILATLSAWWFNRLSHIVPNHLVSTRPWEIDNRLEPYRELLKHRAMLVRRAEPLPVECVVRGYLAGSGWKDYQQNGSVCGIPVRAGYRLADRLDQPIFTPATKAHEGHDQNISFDRVCKLVGRGTAEFLREKSIQIYRYAAELAHSRNIIIADTKFEFGRLPNGTIILIDEVLTPDSSRFWPAESYAPGSPPISFDKQYVRDYLESTGWTKTPPAPPLPPEVVARTREKYIEAYEKLTGQQWPPDD